MFEDILPKLIKRILKGILNQKKSILKNLIPYDTRLFSPQHKKYQIIKQLYYYFIVFLKGLAQKYC